MYKTQYYDLILVDVEYSRDGQSFDALALKHLYTKAFLDRGMATLKPITATHDQQSPFGAVLETETPMEIEAQLAAVAPARKFTCNPLKSGSGCLRGWYLSCKFKFSVDLAWFSGISKPIKFILKSQEPMAALANYSSHCEGNGPRI